MHGTGWIFDSFALDGFQSKSMGSRSNKIVQQQENVVKA
jgi:hypothetical protein